MYIFNYVPHNAPSYSPMITNQPFLLGSHYQKEAAAGTQQSSKTTRTSLLGKNIGHWRNINQGPS